MNPLPQHTTQSLGTRPGEHVELSVGLPRSIAGLRQLVQRDASSPWPGGSTIARFQRKDLPKRALAQWRRRWPESLDWMIVPW